MAPLSVPEPSLKPYAATRPFWAEAISGIHNKTVRRAKTTERLGKKSRERQTDNFKVRGSIQEIDTRFFPDLNRNGIQDLPWEQFMDGLGITWFDTVGGSNRKWSYYNPSISVFHEAHVEAVEKGRHRILIQNQDGCTVGAVYKAGKKLPKKGPQAVSVNVPQDFKGSDTVFIDVACLP